MSLTGLAAIGSFVSGIAVLASLIFVGFQLRQNTKAIRAEASQAHAQNWQQINHADCRQCGCRANLAAGAQ
jgi:anaerobic selenocysteine-containing dehydrogenase